MILKLVPKDGYVSLLPAGTQFLITEHVNAEILRLYSDHVNFTGKA